MHRNTQIKKNEKGQSMVELALSIVVIMILLAGTVDLGRAFFTWLALRDAAQEGASYGSYRPTDVTGIKNRVWDNLGQLISNPTVNVLVSPVTSPVSGACQGDTITVVADYPTFPITMPFLGTLLGSQQMRIYATINDTIILPLCP